MSKRYIVSIDQSTQGTKALLLDERGELLHRVDVMHQQIVNEKGWVSHNPMELYHNTLLAVKGLVKQSGIDPSKVIGIGISNQRETSVIWNKTTGEPLDNAVVWQCSRAANLCERSDIKEESEMIKNKTGMRLSPFFPAAKIAWMLEHVEGARKLQREGNLCHGTIDSWLIYCLTKGRSYKTDYSNASRTQLFDIFKLQWDEEICKLFEIKTSNLPEVCDSDGFYGETDFNGVFEKPIPIYGVLGDSHGALFGQGCLSKGMMKTTYGTGSSIMMNIGETPVLSTHGVVTSLAWKRKGAVSYVLEGNLNYTGAVITWLRDDLGLISSPNETETLAMEAIKDDSLYLVPAFSGLGAPYWDNYATAAIIGMTRTTKRRELVRAGVECIAYQIADVINSMCEDTKIKVTELYVDGGPTKNRYLMQFQSDILGRNVRVSKLEELSGIGVAYMAGISIGLWDETIFNRMNYVTYHPKMDEQKRNDKLRGWKQAVTSVLTKGKGIVTDC